jgi:hypothetical protein
MICWVCAGLSFWGAAAVLGICAALQAFHVLRGGGLHWPRAGRHISQPAR